MNIKIALTKINYLKPLFFADTVNKSVTGDPQNLSDSQFSFFKDYYPILETNSHQNYFAYELNYAISRLNIPYLSCNKNNRLSIKIIKSYLTAGNRRFNQPESSIKIPPQNPAINYAQNSSRPGKVAIYCENGRNNCVLPEQIYYKIN